MSDDFEVRGAEDFQRLSKALKDAGQKELRKELHKSLRDVTKPLVKETQTVLATAVPRRLSGRGAATKQTVQLRTGNDAGVRIAVAWGRKAGRGFGASNARLLDQRGLIRHPLFGNRAHWYTTAAPRAAGWFTKTLADKGPLVRPELEAAMARVADKVVRQARA